MEKKKRFPIDDNCISEVVIYIEDVLTGFGM